MGKTIKKRVLSLALALVVVMTSVFSMPSVDVNAATKVKVDKKIVKLNRKSVTINKGKSVKLKATKGKKVKNKKLVWTTSNKKVATVDKNGKVTAKKDGKATITVKVKGTKYIAKCSVKVVTPQIKIKKIKAKQNKAVLFVGDKFTVKTVTSPKKVTNSKLTYTTSNKNVATVSKKGVVKAVGVGSATITAKTTDGSKKKATVKITVPSTSIAISEPAARIAFGTSYQLVAAVNPENATNRTVTWASDNPAVATVDQNGVVTGVGIGTANIFASSVYGDTIACAVTVDAIAYDFNTLCAYITNPGLSTVYYASNAVESFEIPEGDFTTKNLVIDAPNATITNKGNFASVTINQIAQNTYLEYGVNNVFYNAPAGHLIVGETGNATINLSTTNSSVLIENNGTIGALNVNTQVNLNISGRNQVPVHIMATAVNTSITSSVALNITASATWTMALLPGAEDTTASIDSSACAPIIYGVGVISVYVADVNDSVNIAAERTDWLQIDGQAEVDGKVKKHYVTYDEYDGEYNYHSADAEGANVYLIGYNSANSGIDFNNYGQFISGVVSATVGTNGSYSIPNVPYGNYWLVVQLEGYRTSVQSITISSNNINNGIFNNELIDIISNEMAAAPNAETVSGYVKDGATSYGYVPQGVTVKLRSGSNNVSGVAIQVTTVDSNGRYTFTNVPAGVYTVEAIDLRQNLTENDITYDQASKKIIVANGFLSTTGSSYNVIMPRHYVNSTVSGTGEVQFTLEWGNEETGADRDLDSHLFGPRVNGDVTPFHTYYSRKQYKVNADGSDNQGDNYYGFSSYDSVTYADLDVDDTTYEGPEHTTIYHQTAGIYRFYVHDFTQWRSSNSAAESSNMGLANSSAKVTVSIGSVKRTIYCPNKPGTVWYVGYYDSTTRTFHPVNQMGIGNMPYGDNFNQIVTGTGISPSVIGYDINEIFESAKEKANN